MNSLERWEKQERTDLCRESPGDEDRIPLALRWEQTLWEAMCSALWDGGQLSWQLCPGCILPRRAGGGWLPLRVCTPAIKSGVTESEAS